MIIDHKNLGDHLEDILKLRALFISPAKYFLSDMIIPKLWIILSFQTIPKLTDISQV